MQWMTYVSDTLRPMKKMLDSLWRTVSYCVCPPVIVLSLVPLLTLLLAVVMFAYFGWQPAVSAMQGWLQGGLLETWTLRGMTWLGLAENPGLLPRLLVLCMAIPSLVLVCLLVVTWLSTPALVRIISRRRFPDLEQKHGGNLLTSAFWSLGNTALALGLIVASLPLWLLPPLALVIPPLIGGWLVAKLLPYDVLADHASKEERIKLLKRHRWELLTMGVIAGLLGSAPSLLLASGAWFVALFFIMAPIAIWLYALVFIFSTLWFGHFCLRALELLRQEDALANGTPPAANDNTSSPRLASSSQPHHDSEHPIT